jgi:hypothetical protein
MRPFLLIACLLLGGCSSRNIHRADTGSTGSTGDFSTTNGDPAASNSESDGNGPTTAPDLPPLPDLPEPEDCEVMVGIGKKCDGETCSNILADYNNCGACGRVCENDLGKSFSCVDGICGVVWTPCFTRDTGFTSCSHACMAYGHTCSNAPHDQHGCGDQPQAFFFGDDTECTSSSGTPTPKTCDDPLAWEELEWFDEVTGARCCCLFG